MQDVRLGKGPDVRSQTVTAGRPLCCGRQRSDTLSVWRVEAKRYAEAKTSRAVP